MSMSVLILGNGSAIPTLNRNPSAQLLTVNGTHYLIDCGEGTQLQLRRNKVKLQRINYIFITHMHGDHYLGLMGLLLTMNLLGRKSSLKLIGPSYLKEMIELHLKISSGDLNFPIDFIATNHVSDDLIHEDNRVEVSIIPLKHKIWCTGFFFREKEKPRKLIANKIIEFQIPINQRKGIKEGRDYLDDKTDTWIKNEELTLPPPPSYTYAYCSDTMYNEKILEKIQDVDVLYHESTFIEEDKQKAKKTKHSTAIQAATIALKANAGSLILGHYSNRYKDLSPFLTEAKSIFENTSLSKEGNVYEISR